MTRDVHLEAVAGLLEQRIGMRADRALSVRAERVIRRQAAAAGMSLAVYSERVTAVGEEFDRLVDAVSVQETSFFRHPEQLAVLGRTLLTQPPRVADRVIWVAGCATGQEAWSAAMLLAECGLTGWRVVATDVSGEAIARATDAEYAPRQLNGLSEERRARFLRPTDGNAMRITDPLRDRVAFVRHNLLDGIPREAGECGVVLCRNVLIYLTRETSQRLLGRLRARMPDDGILVIGAAETLAPQHSAFRPERNGRVYMYRPRIASAMPFEGPVPATPRIASRRPRPAREASRPAAQPRLPTVHELVAEGERLMAADRPGEAITSFRKAVYIEPGNPVPAIRLALALNSTGDPEAGRALRAARAAVSAADPDRLAEDLDGWPASQIKRLLDGKLEVIE